jgi:hypothetical protein
MDAALAHGRNLYGNAPRGSCSPLEEYSQWMLTLVAEQPDLTLDEIVDAMRKRRIADSRSAV